jgi:hypothetical protein
MVINVESKRGTSTKQIPRIRRVVSKDNEVPPFGCECKAGDMT